ncbi:MAG TPA: glutamine-hydrolyzing GMP synthase, partial [Agitococcus sp.]|nr:glutamine-hydrolyzing GMP synthase [Agitococcus sp.]
AEVNIAQADSLFNGIEDRTGFIDVWMSHGDKVTRLPEGFNITASTPSCPIAAMSCEAKRFYGMQFHPEVTHTLQGEALLRRFVREICACDDLWTPAQIIEDSIRRIREQVGDDHVLLGLSGGVDSSVVAALLHRAIGDKLTCVFVDNGLLRKNEGDMVMDMFAKNMGVKVIRADAEAKFLGELAGVADPEQKRKIIGRVFIEVFDSESAKLNNIKWLAQGTIYPDVIESAASKTGKAHVIKSHHNVGGLPEDMKFKLLEPLRELFKDEVRKIGLELGLPYDMVYRHPFPGPGLGVRILGEVKKEYADVLREADAIFLEELHKAGWYHRTSQSFAVFLPVKSVGVVGDGRRYAWVIALRAVETIDFMTARWAHLPYELIEKVSNRIINEISGVSRVVYDVSSKPPATIEWE